MYLILDEKRSRYYQVVYEKNGKITSVSTKSTNRQEALMFLFQFRESDKYQTEVKIPSLQKFSDEYIETMKAGYSKHYIDSIKLSFDMLIKFAGDIPLEKVNLRIVEAFISQTFVRAQNAAALYYRTLKCAFNKAIKWKYLQSNPFKELKAPRVQKKFPAIISSKDFKSLLEKVTSPLLKDIFITAFLTGMRLGEIINLKWRDVELQSEIIYVRNTNEFSTKNKKDRIIPMNKELKVVLKNRYRKLLKTVSSNNVIVLPLNNYVFSLVDGIRLRRGYVTKKFKQASRAAELDERVHAHSCRHSFASQLVQNGVSIYVVKELLGHEDIKTTQIYAHVGAQNLTDAVSKISVYGR